MRKWVLNMILLLLAGSAFAQDPHFSQYFMAPQLMNPATVGTGSGNWRVAANYRQQWGNAGTPFTTSALSTDWKMDHNEMNSGYVGAGFTMMSDQSMSGAFKSIYVNGALAYHASFGERQGLGLALQCSYGSRRIDYSQLTFGEQFTSGGFDLSLPTGENALGKMKPFVSVGAGLLYHTGHDYMNFEIGAAAFHLNKPEQSFVEDENQQIPTHYTAHANLDMVPSDLVVLNLGVFFQQQARQSYFTGGGTIGYDLSNGDRKNIFFLGGFYRLRDAAYPYIGLLLNNFQIGASYDITMSKQNKGPYTPRSFELSIMFRGFRKDGVIPCPWK